MNQYLAQRALSDRRILVCVCGGVAAYKIAETVSLLVQARAKVWVAMTPEATRFVAPLTFEALSGQPVSSDLFGKQAVPGIEGGEVHISLSDWPEAILVAPATANVTAKLARGLADEIVSTTILASNAPLVIAPAMHERMWTHPATQENVAMLRERGVIIAGPVEGRLASGEVGMGRLADQEDILRALCLALPGIRDMEGVSVVVSAGGTREPIDPVRFIGNRSSGLMGHAIAAVAELRGARVTLVTTSALSAPRGVEVRRVATAAEMQQELRSAVAVADMLVMAAAVADFRPRSSSPRKVPKAEMPAAVELEPNPDIVATIPAESASGARRLLRVGFAAETENLLQRAEEKLRAKDLDMVVANDVSDPVIGMGSAENAVTILTRDGRRIELERAPKEDIADQVLTLALELRKESRKQRVS